MSAQERQYWRSRAEALRLELAGVEALLAELKGAARPDVALIEFWTQRRRAIITERRAIVALLGPAAGGDDPRQAHAGADPRMRGPG